MTNGCPFPLAALDDQPPSSSPKNQFSQGYQARGPGDLVCKEGEDVLWWQVAKVDPEGYIDEATKGQPVQDGLSPVREEGQRNILSGEDTD